MLGPKGSVTLLLIENVDHKSNIANEEKMLTWIRLHRSPELSYKKLNEEVFIDAMLSTIDA
jgi:hypothetical protein